VRIVVKIGGSLMKEGVPANLVADAASLAASHQLVMVHGGGDVVTEIATKLGKEQRFVVSPEGMRSRYTDKETAEIYQMVMTGLLANRLVLALGKAGARAVSLSGPDASLMAGKRKSKLVMVDDRGRKVAIDGGYTGKVRSVNSQLVELLLSQGYLPVVSPVAVSEEFDPLNIDGDRAASSIASGIKADVVVFATNVDGLSLDGALVSDLSATEARARLPKIGYGMQKKVIASAEAVEAGVKEAIICSGIRENPIMKALAHESCTVVTGI
jgi:acetylglutamate/LysW-gamma-L-alpha-aminoadipate kinase